MSVSLVFHLIREHLIGPALDLGQDKCGRSRISFVHSTKKPVVCCSHSCCVESYSVCNLVCFVYDSLPVQSVYA